MGTRLRLWDIAAVALSVGVTVFFSWFAYGGAGGEAFLYIQDDSQIAVYPLSVEGEVSVFGPLGETHIVIHDGGASVTDSPCRDKLCMSMGHISRRGGWIACLPNRVFLRVDAPHTPTDGETDAAAY
jgi:hypothetical protein